MKPQIPPHPTRLYLIRHGEVDERYHQVFSGSQIDMALSPAGHGHGLALSEWMAGRALDRIYASPMLRVQQTIAPLLQARGMEASILPGLREVDFGAWTGFRWHEIQERFGVSAFNWLEIIDNGGIPEGETAAGLLARVSPCLQHILDSNAHGSVGIACHGGIVRVILALLLELPLSKTAHFSVDYGSVTVVEVQPDKKHAIEIDLLNFCPGRDGNRG